MRVTGSQKEELWRSQKETSPSFSSYFWFFGFFGFLFLFLLFPALIQTVICEKSENFKKENENES